MMQKNWTRMLFPEVIEDASSGNPKIQTGEYLESGKYPIVDQGQSFIAGFTNQVEKLCKTDLPVIVFGDHTKILKFIDFQFAIGADGVKVLKPNKQMDVKYAYHYLKTLNLPDVGYSRHFKFLKEVQIPLPPLEQQQKIAQVLDAVDSLLGKRREGLKKLEVLLKSVFLEMFGDPVTNPKSWEILPLEALVQEKRPITYGILKPGDDQDDGVPYVRVLDMDLRGINIAGLRKTTLAIDQEYKRSRLKPGFYHDLSPRNSNASPT
jgi:type I restriction enzyme, S subunit